ncbi:TonB-dependent receptor plug domain-containing protein [uncultured Halomonas sp.]|uniref:TonB-dependent receptor plug domain-containing protein n=1 Tax=uncultured Halomonas sp. TaxID=173971 RepID=UPI00262BF059|nr:TonB-dependent receptor plug domain-containing protein [uncultured Halomonas sp.]
MSEHSRSRLPAQFGLSLASLLTCFNVAWAESPQDPCPEERDCTAAASDRLDTIIVHADHLLHAGRASYDSQDIAEMPTGNGHLSDLLRLNTAVDFSRDANQSANSATLKPGEISIHGQPFYQNLFTLDGIDMSSDLDPANNQDLWSTPSLVRPTGGSSPQGFFLDVDLLESVEVFDSNVPAAYGGFTGGVVATRLKRYDGEDSVALRYGQKRDEWESFHVNESDRKDPARNYRGDYTPDYLRQNYSISLQQGLGDVSGMTMNVSRRTSRFAQSYEDSAGVLRHIDYDDRIDNILGRVDTRVGEDKLGLSFRYTDRSHDGLTGSRYDDRFVKSHEAIGATLHWEREVAVGDFSLDLGVDRLSDTLENDSDHFVYKPHLRGSDQPSHRGGYGSTEQAQTRATLAPELRFNDLALGRSRHRLTTGAQLRHTQSYYERPNDVSGEMYRCCDGQGNAYLSTAHDYYAGKVDLTYNDLAWYLEDRIALGDWTVTTGVRADWNGYMDNVDIAPRFKAEWDTFGDGSTRLVAGANRYYGRNFLRYKLNDAISSWREIRFFAPDGGVLRTLDYDDESGISDLDTPYSDELMVGWLQQMGPVHIKLQFVNRESRDGILRAEEEDGLIYYRNDGRSSTDSLTLDIAMARPWQLGATLNHASLGISYRETSRSSYQGSGGYDLELQKDPVYYQGKLIDKDELPAWDFNIPVDVRLQTVTHVPGWHLTWSNFFNLRQGGSVARDSFEDYQDTETGRQYDIYEDVDFDALMTVDTRLRWEPPILSRAQGFIQMEVLNLFNDSVDYSTSDYSSKATAGRSGSLEVGLRF